MRKIDRRRAATWRVIAMLEHEMTAAIFGAPILKPCWSGGICGEEPPVRSAYAIILGG